MLLLMVFNIHLFEDTDHVNATFGTGPPTSSLQTVFFRS